MTEEALTSFTVSDVYR